MTPQTLETRVESLEQRVTRLEELPARMDRLESQIVQLRTEMRAEFSVAREETRAGDDRVVATLRDEIRAGDERVVTTLRDEIRAGDEETRHFMRLLHEQVISDIATLGEARQTPGPKRARLKKKPGS